MQNSIFNTSDNKKNNYHFKLKAKGGLKVAVSNIESIVSIIQVQVSHYCTYT